MPPQVVKNDSGSNAVFTEQGFVSITNDGRECSGCHRQTTKMRWTSERRRIRLHRSQNGGRCNTRETFMSDFPDSWIRPPRYTWTKKWQNIEEPVVPLERNFYGHPLAGL